MAQKEMSLSTKRVLSATWCNRQYLVYGSALQSYRTLTGVCEINTHRDGAGVVNVPNRARAPMCQHARAALIKTMLAHPVPLNQLPIGQNMFKSKLAQGWPSPGRPAAARMWVGSVRRIAT